MRRPMLVCSLCVAAIGVLCDRLPAMQEPVSPDVAPRIVVPPEIVVPELPPVEPVGVQATPGVPEATVVPQQPASDAPVVTAPADAADDEVLLSGPVHEAFAEQYNQDPVPGIIVSRQPPEAIEELPPDVRPEGRQVEWISGYWAWDDDEQDFFWVSGIWREVPQGFRWVPGYWTPVDGGFQWVSGTWITETTAEIQYLETAPPESLELGPVGTAPTVDHIWIPGCWQWNAQRYAWRPGYWSTGYTNWIWIPARYLWTPRGYIYCNGYWDYPLTRRGTLFAPGRFRQLARWNRSQRYTPQIVIATNLIQWSFWVRPQYRHYYFGDYYGDRFARRGFVPWHQYTRQRRHYDPIFQHFSRSQVASNVDFYRAVDQRFTLLRDHEDRRPLRSVGWSNAVQMINREHQRMPRGIFDRHDLDRDDSDSVRILAGTLQDQMRDVKDVRFVRMEDNVRERHREHSDQIREILTQRRAIESDALNVRDRDNGDRGRRADNDPVTLQIPSGGTDGLRDAADREVRNLRDRARERADREMERPVPDLNLADGQPGRNREVDGGRRADDKPATGDGSGPAVSTTDPDRSARQQRDQERDARRERPSLRLPPVRTDESNVAAGSGNSGSFEDQVNQRRNEIRNAIEQGSERRNRNNESSEQVGQTPEQPASRADRPRGIDSLLNDARRRTEERNVPSLNQNPGENVDKLSDAAVRRQQLQQERQQRLEERTQSVPERSTRVRSNEDRAEPRIDIPQSSVRRGGNSDPAESRSLRIPRETPEVRNSVPEVRVPREREVRSMERSPGRDADAGRPAGLPDHASRALERAQQRASEAATRSRPAERSRGNEGPPAERAHRERPGRNRD